MVLGPASSVVLAAFANATFEAPSRVAYTALFLALTMILKRCRLLKVEVAERNRTMQKFDRLGPKGQNSLTKDPGVEGDRSIDSELGVWRRSHLGCPAHTPWCHLRMPYSSPSQRTCEEAAWQTTKQYLPLKRK
jgi:hypothetical protein